MYVCMVSNEMYIIYYCKLCIYTLYLHRPIDIVFFYIAIVSFIISSEYKKHISAFLKKCEIPQCPLQLIVVSY